MTAWDTICRVCSSPAQYEIFEKIPTYLHETSNEFINWQKPINIILEETTGLKVSQDDGLPSTICALCISYMKHASSFRDQVIKNSLSLQVIKHLSNIKQHIRPEDRDKDKDNLLVIEPKLNISEQRILDTNVLTDKFTQKVSKELFQHGLSMPSQEYVTQQMHYLNLLFDKDLNSGMNEINKQNGSECENSGNRQQSADIEDYETESTSNEDNDDENFATTAITKGHIFSYTEKNFEEDDVINLDQLRDVINITIPETCKERKCRACFRRFMFEDSYEEHMEKCIEYKFLVFIEEINLLLDIRRKKAVSPHEFIRRMIFSLRKICEFLKLNCDEVLLLPEQPISSNVAENSNNSSNLKDKADIGETILLEENSENKILKSEETDTPSGDLTIPQNDNSFTNVKDNHVIDIYNLSQQILGTSSPTAKDTTTPISVHNNILYEIERSQSRNANKLKTTNMESENNVKVMRPIPMHPSLQSQENIITSVSKMPTNSSAEERLTFLQKLERAVNPTTEPTPEVALSQASLTIPPISVRKDLMTNTNMIPSSPSSFSACCNPCNLIFDTLNAFEIHNAVYHNKTRELETQREEERNRIIAMFENEDDI